MLLSDHLLYEIGVATCNLVYLSKVKEVAGEFDLEGHIESVSMQLEMVETGYDTTVNTVQGAFTKGFLAEAENLELFGPALLELFKSIAHEGYEMQEQTIQYTETIEVSEHQANVIEEVLAIEEGASEDYGSDEVIHVEVFEFEDKYKSLDEGQGWMLDVKVCNGDTPYVDPVLFLNIDNTGHELTTNDVEDTFLGEYTYTVDGVLYGVPVIHELTGIITIEK